jgi:hypothetical protein
MQTIHLNELHKNFADNWVKSSRRFRHSVPEEAHADAAQEDDERTGGGRTGIDFMKPLFGQNVFGQIFILQLLSNFYPKNYLDTDL